ncbi:THAP domain-containing protein 4-like [Pseudomyrmex gracilis]|uniref:THAP domain-containing protein 4-like n=1 Tax=Pseudomyrmex gracilis TaxID=219809 RepID=UPI00099520BC|nr:THAP domain-containing protein 4-like [Pseudomyrmex gracilis]
MQMKNLPLNEMLHVLAWLEGIWITDEPAIVQFPTMKQSMNYYDQINITSLGQPWLNYVAQSWHAETGDPMHRETGFVQITSDNKVAFYLINPLDMVTVEQGELTNNNMTIDLKSTKIVSNIGMMKIPSFSSVKETRRVYNFDGNNLELIFYMATEKTPVLTEHLRAKYRKM